MSEHEDLDKWLSETAAKMRNPVILEMREVYQVLVTRWSDKHIMSVGYHYEIPEIVTKEEKK